MAMFTYTLVTKAGETIESKEDYPDKFAFFEAMKSQGKLISYEEVSETFLDKMAGKVGKMFSRIGTHQKILFARNLGTMISSGLSLARALSVLRRQSHNKAFTEVIGSLEEDVKKGLSLHEALGRFPKVFSDLFVSMVKAGEESGELTTSLDVVSTQMDHAFRLKKKVKGAMIYPAVVMFAMVIVGILMMIFVVPTLTSTFEDLDLELPAATKLIIATSKALRHNPFLVALGFAAVGAGGVFISKTKFGHRILDTLSLKVPVIKGLMKESSAAATTRTMSSLLSSGVDVVRSLEITGEVIQNSYYQPVIIEAKEEVTKGGNLSDVFSRHENLYPIFVSEMMKVGEETGKISEMMTNVADYYEEEVFQKTEDMSTIIEPFLMIIVGGVVGFFVISIITPMYSLVNAI